MIRYAMLSLLLIAPAVGRAQGNDASAPVPTTRTMQVKFPPEDLVTIPIKQVKGIILLPAQIGGQQIDVLFDNGSDSTVIDAQMARRSGMTLMKGVGQIHAGSAVIPLGLTEGSMVIGGSLKIDGQMMAADLGKLSQALGTPVGAIIGADILKAMVVVINPARGWIAAALPGHMNITVHANVNIDKTRPNAADSLIAKLAPVAIPFDQQQIVRSTINGRPVNLKVDYGSNGAISLRDDIWRQAIPPEDRSPQAHIATRAAGNQVKELLGTAKSVEIGSVSARNVPVASTGAADINGYEGLIGLAVLGSSVTALNMTRQQLVIFPVNQDVSVSATPSPTASQ